MSEVKAYYESRLRHLETPEFKQWFETWYAKEEEYDGNEALRDEYLRERNMALAGFLAGRREDSHLMSKLQFVTMCLPPRKESYT